MTQTVTMPNRTRTQRLEALLRANEVRAGRKELKWEIADGDRDPVEVVEDPPDVALTMKVFDFLLAIPKVGRVKANKLLIASDMSPSKTLGGMSERQRRALVRLLRAQAARFALHDAQLSRN